MAFKEKYNKYELRQDIEKIERQKQYLALKDKIYTSGVPEVFEDVKNDLWGCGNIKWQYSYNGKKEITVKIGLFQSWPCYKPGGIEQVPSSFSKNQKVKYPATIENKCIYIGYELSQNGFFKIESSKIYSVEEPTKIETTTNNQIKNLILERVEKLKEYYTFPLINEISKDRLKINQKLKSGELLEKT